MKPSRALAMMLAAGASIGPPLASDSYRVPYRAPRMPRNNRKHTTSGVGRVKRRERKSR